MTEAGHTSTNDEMEQLQQSLEETRLQLSEARGTISRLEAENAELRRRLDEPEAQEGGSVGNKNGQADGEVNGTTAQPQDTGAASSQSAPLGQDGGANEEKKDEDTNATGISSASRPEETNGEQESRHNKIEEKGADDNAPAQDTDQPVQNGRKDDEQDDASVESTNDVESESDDNDEDDDNNKEPPTSPADDIRLRAARTLIWADSAIKRAEALKEQQQQASSSQQASQQASASEQSSLVGGSGSRRGGKPPSTVRFSQSVDDDSRADDDSSFLSDEDDDDDDDDDAAAGPLARIGRFLEDKMDDVAERLVAMDPSDKGSLQSGSVGGGAGTGTGKPPRSPANYKYCNDAMKKKMGGDGEDDSHSARTPTSGDGSNDSDKKAPPRMNEAMKRLSSEKNKRGGLGSRLFKG